MVQQFFPQIPPSAFDLQFRGAHPPVLDTTGNVSPPSTLQHYRQIPHCLPRGFRRFDARQIRGLRGTPTKSTWESTAQSIVFLAKPNPKNLPSRK